MDQGAVAGGEKPSLHVSLVLLAGQLLVLAQGAFAIATAVNLLRGAQTLGDVSAGFKPLDLSPAVVTGTAVAAIVVGALFMAAGLRVRRMSLRGRVPIVLIELVLMLISSIAIAVGGQNLSVISVAVLAFAGSPILPGAAVLGVEAAVIYALLIHPMTDVVRWRRQVAALKPPLRVYLQAQPHPSLGTKAAPPPRYAGPPAPAQESPQPAATSSPRGKRIPAPPGAAPAPSAGGAGAEPAPSPEPRLRVMPPVSPRLVIPARDGAEVPTAALDLRIAATPPRPLSAAPPPRAAPPPSPPAPAILEAPAPDEPAAAIPPPQAPAAASPHVERVRGKGATTPPAPPAAAPPASPAPPAPTLAASDPAPAKSEPSPFVGLRPAARKKTSKRPANQQLLRPARGTGAELRDIRLKPRVRPTVLPPPDNDYFVDEE